MRVNDLKYSKPQESQLPKQYFGESLDFGKPIESSLAVSMFGSDVINQLSQAKGTGIVFTRDQQGRNWKLLKKTDGKLYAERDFISEGDFIVFEDHVMSVSGQIVSISETTMIIEEQTTADSTLDEGAGKWLSIAAILGLFGLGLGQVLDTAAPEKTPLGQALAQAAKTDAYAAEQLKKLGMYIETGDWDKIAQLNDTYLNVKYDDRYLAANPQVDFSQNWSRNTLTGKAVKAAIDENQAATVINKTFGAMADSISSSTIRRAGMLAMQGRYPEAEGALRQHLAKLDPSVAKQVQDSIKNIKPVTINGKTADTSALEKSKQHTDWLDNTFVPWILKLTGNKNEGIENWKMNITSIPRTEPFKLKKIVVTSKFGKTYTFDTEQEARRYFGENWDKITDPVWRKANGWKLDMNNTKAEISLDEAEYQGREVKLGKPMRGDVKKFKVYVRDPKTGNVKKVNFGDKNMEIKRDDPARRKNYRARHGCGTARASDRTKAAYWSCRLWSSKKVSDILKGK